MEEFKISMAKGKGGHGESINKAATSSEEVRDYSPTVYSIRLLTLVSANPIPKETTLGDC